MTTVGAWQSVELAGWACSPCKPEHMITRSGIRSLLTAQKDVEIVGEAQNGEETVELASSTQPDVILMDLRMPGINGIDAAS